MQALWKKLQLKFSENQLKSQIQSKNDWTGNEKIQWVWWMKKSTIGWWLEKNRSICGVLKWPWENYPHALEASSWHRKKLGWLRFKCANKKWQWSSWTTAPCRLGGFSGLSHLTWVQVTHRQCSHTIVTVHRHQVIVSSNTWSAWGDYLPPAAPQADFRMRFIPNSDSDSTFPGLRFKGWNYAPP